MAAAREVSVANRGNRSGTGRRNPVVLDGDDPTAAAIIVAAVGVMAEHGYHGTSVRDIATAAEVSPAALYHHFGSKHDLLATILDRGIGLLVRETEEALFHAGDDPATRLSTIVGVHVLAHIQSQRESFLGNSELRSLSPATRALVISKRDTQQRMFDRVIADGVRRGVFTTPYPTEASRTVVTACTAVASWYRRDGELTPREIVGRYQTIALGTVGYRAEEPEKAAP